MKTRLESVVNWLLSNLLPLLHWLEAMPVGRRLSLMVLFANVGVACVFVVPSEAVATLLFVASLCLVVVIGRTVEASFARVHDYVARFGVDGCDYVGQDGQRPCGKMPVVVKRCEHHQLNWPNFK